MEHVSDVTGIAELSASRARLRVSGEERVDFLHGQCTNDIQRLAVGESCYAALPTAKGKMHGGDTSFTNERPSCSKLPPEARRRWGQATGLAAMGQADRVDNCGKG